MSKNHAPNARASPCAARWSLIALGLLWLLPGAAAEGPLPVPAEPAAAGVEPLPVVDVGADFTPRCSGKVTQSVKSTEISGSLIEIGFIRIFTVKYTNVEEWITWEYSCKADVNAWAAGSGSALREVTLEAQADTGDHVRHATCRYDGVLATGCVARVESKNYAFRKESGEGTNQPISTTSCVVPSLRGVNRFQPDAAADVLKESVEKKAQEVCRTATIQWTHVNAETDTKADLSADVESLAELQRQL